MWLILGKWCVSLCRTITRERWMKAKMITNPRVSVHQCIPWVSAQVPNVSKPTSSGWRPQTKLSKYGYFPYNDLNVMISYRFMYFASFARSFSLDVSVYCLIQSILKCWTPISRIWLYNFDWFPSRTLYLWSPILLLKPQVVDPIYTKSSISFINL